MAISIATVHQSSVGNLRLWIGTVTFGPAYAAGGETYSASKFNMAANPLILACDSPLNYAFLHDRVAGKIKVFLHGVERADTTVVLNEPMEAVVVNVLALGF